MGEKKDIPGAQYEEVVKKSRRKNKKTTKEESTEAGRSSNVSSPSPAQQGSGPGLSAQKLSMSTKTVQTPAPASARQPIPAPSQPYPGIQSVKPTETPRPQVRASQDLNKRGSSAQLGAAQINPTTVIPHQEQAGKGDTKSMPSTGALPTASTEISKTKYLTGGPIHRIGTAQGDREITHLARPTRPGHGERGSRVQLFTNYFKLRAKPDLVLHRYSITVIPELKGKKLDKIINNVLDLPQFNALRLGIATDFSAFMVSCTLLSQDHQNFSVPMATGLSVDELRNAKKYAVLISFVSTFVLSQFDGTKPYLADQESLPVVQDLDIVLGHHRKSSQDVAAVGKRKVFSMNPPATYADFPGVLKALRGFFCNVRFCENGPLVNVNVSNSPFWKQGPLTNVVRALQTDGEINDTKIPALLRGLRVQLIYIKDKTVFRTISGYACHGDGDGYMPHPPRVPRGIFGPGPEDVQFFWEKNPPNEKRKEERNDSKVKPHAPGCSCVGKYVSVSSYFAEKYRIQFDRNDMNLPVVNIGNANHPAYLPLKVCAVLAQASKMKLNPNETKIMQRFAVRTPDRNATDIKDEGFRTLGLGSRNQRLVKFGLGVEQNFVTVQGRALFIPKLMFKGGTTKETRQRSKWDLNGVKFMEAKPLENWSCLNIHSGIRPQEDPTFYVKGFVNELRNCGITCQQPDIDNVQLNTINTAPEAKSVLAEWFKHYSEPQRNIRFLLVILPRNIPDLYNHIKRVGDQDHGVLTCCVVGSGDRFFNQNSYKAVQYNANVALKVNLKLGGVNHVLVQGQLYNIKELEGKTMVIGIDVTHPSVGSSENAPSIAAMVASDKQLAQWPADLRINTSREEMVEKLEPMLVSRLEWWRKKYKDLPENLLVYRDGVSEGQYQTVLDQEMPKIRDACKKVYEQLPPPKISLIVVGKRHHTRFMRTTGGGKYIDSSDDGRASNPEPGTVVDNTITSKAHSWEFYLQSHKPIMGTARPAHYFVLVDEIFRQWTKATIPRPFKNPAEILEQVTQNLCLLFGRATTSVSIPPPVYYADIACERGRRYLSRFFDPRAQKLATSMITDWDVEVHPDLRDTMFYI